MNNQIAEARYSATKGLQFFGVTALGGIADTSIQIWLFYTRPDWFVAISPGVAGEWGMYAAAAVIGGIINVTVCYILKTFWVFRNQRSITKQKSTSVRYVLARFILMFPGAAITYVPIWLFGAELAVTSVCSFIITTSYLLYKSPVIFAVGTEA